MCVLALQTTKLGTIQGCIPPQRQFQLRHNSSQTRSATKASSHSHKHTHSHTRGVCVMVLTFGRHCGRVSRLPLHTQCLESKREALVRRDPPLSPSSEGERAAKPRTLYTRRSGVENRRRMRERVSGRGQMPDNFHVVSELQRQSERERERARQSVELTSVGFWGFVAGSQSLLHENEC